MKNERPARDHVECFSLLTTTCFILVGNSKLTVLLVKCMTISSILRLTLQVLRKVYGVGIQIMPLFKSFYEF